MNLKIFTRVYSEIIYPNETQYHLLQTALSIYSFNACN